MGVFFEGKLVFFGGKTTKWLFFYKNDVFQSTFLTGILK